MSSVACADPIAEISPAHAFANVACDGHQNPGERDEHRDDSCRDQPGATPTREPASGSVRGRGSSRTQSTAIGGRRGKRLGLRIVCGNGTGRDRTASGGHANAGDRLGLGGIDRFELHRVPTARERDG